MAPTPQTEARVETAPSALPGRAVAMVVAGIVAAWFAAGSTGWIAPPLSRVVVWLAMGVAMVAALPSEKGKWGRWAAYAGLGAIAGLLMTAQTLPAVNVLAVAVTLAMLARTQCGVAGRAVLLATTAVAGFALFRLAVESIPIVWLLADNLGRTLGLLVGWVAGRPLRIGATFGGIDLLVLMAALYAGWLAAVRRPRRHAAVWAAVAIVAGHGAYLFVLAFSPDLTAELPPVVQPKFTEVSMRGVWAWGNAVRGLLPWNLPLVAVVLQSIVAAVMFRWANWVPVAEAEGRGGQPISVRRASGPPAPGRRNKKVWQNDPAAAAMDAPVLARKMLVQLGPGLLAILLVAATWLCADKPDLKERRVLLYEAGGADWSKAENDSATARAAQKFGLLRSLIESLGGSATRSAELSEDELLEADVVVLLPPAATDAKSSSPEAFSADCLERIWSFVRRGGGLLVAAEPEGHRGATENLLNPALEPTAIRLHDDTAISLTERWEDNCQAAPHPATIGLDAGRKLLGLSRPASLGISWPARPLVVGRWAWSEPGVNSARMAPALQYSSGDRLGDLVLGAEQRLGDGCIVVLGDASCLANESLPASYGLDSRLLGYLAGHGASPQVLWRQLAGLLILAVLFAVLAWRRDPARLAADAVVLAIALVACQAAGSPNAGLLPEGTLDSKPARGEPESVKVAYLDASHLPAFSYDPARDEGLGQFARILAENGYLPLLAPDVSSARLDRAALLISIAPGREFAPAERSAVKGFVQRGGVFISMVGAPEAAASESVLSEFGLKVPPTPVPPSKIVRETVPVRSMDRTSDGANGDDTEQMHFATLDQQAAAYFYACWPIEGGAGSELVAWPKVSSCIVAGKKDKKGQAVLIGDTAFAMNKNLAAQVLQENARFWQWLLVRVSGQGQLTPRPQPKAKTPPTVTPKAPLGSKPQLNEPLEGGAIEQPSRPAKDPQKLENRSKYLIRKGKRS